MGSGLGNAAPLRFNVEYFAAVHADEEVTRHVGGVQTREDAWRAP